jgi:phosphatidylglycerophosphate synthase
MNMNGPERAAEGPSQAPFTGTPLEALGGLAGGIIVNYTDLVNGLTSSDADVRFLMEEYGYALAADTLTAYRLSRIPPIMAIFNKPPGERSWKDARLVAKAWASDRVDGDLADMANRRSPYGAPADKLADKALWAGPSALQVIHGEMHPVVFSSVLIRDLLLERQRNQAARNGDGAAHTAISAGKYKTTLQGITQTFSASPAAARHPQVREALQWATAAASIGSGILTAAEIEKAGLGANYAGRGRLAGIRLGITALSRQGK